MANKKITELPTATTVTGTDLTVVVQGGTTKQAPASALPVSDATATALAAKADTAVVAATYVKFVDLNGNPITGQTVRIIVDTTVTPNQISDIVVM